ncbi:CDGSH iron-sulfur domain-containing protein 3, mitochondrial [Schistocerca americana]|uniref:CDGSH iron-sulfur domain-containing protein 3, mitochondrial n=1 Tax=Schistocerca americana TaxID=7009 RepID=UPI001F4F9FB0|nr:CDGSH iron-sulfur domain-containing protein 3, mitochondrial [Schistocerca americana]XP_049955733.1 CDGSH iron-sulfur domain-containing protein 3, mitochondrial [Schistocerca serialis cubense]
MLCRGNLSARSFRIYFNTSKFYSSGPDKPSVVPQNPLAEIHGASLQKQNGEIYDKKPFKMKCEKGKTYMWCLCGRSKSQPLCDGTHKSAYLNTKLRPVKFQVTEDKEYWLCNCKQTSKRPFCDGTHKRPEIQAAVKS